VRPCHGARLRAVTGSTTQIRTSQATASTLFRCPLNGRSVACPRYVSITDWRVISGMGRSATYLALGRGDLRAVKFGAEILDQLHFEREQGSLGGDRGARRDEVLACVRGGGQVLQPILAPAQA
jgi:hypothetical protein